MLELREVTVRRGAGVVVAGLTAGIGPGRIFWIVGPNGAGKSSLLRVLARLDRPAAGEVVRVPPTEGRYLYFHSEMSLPSSSTVAGWERLVAALVPGPASRSRTALWPDVPGQRKIGRLSTGERKRLLLDALLRNPGALVMDEPYEHLSPDAKSALTAILEARVRRVVVVVATNQATDRVERDGGLRLEAGVVERFGPPAEAAAR